MSSNAQVIHFNVTSKVTSKTFSCSFAYGLHSVVVPRDLWSSLLSWGFNHMVPWMVLGDFNSILSTDDRRGGNS